MNLIPIWRSWNGIVTFALLCALLITGGMWVEAKRDLNRAQNITTIQRIASDYCVSKKYDSTTWKTDFQTCLDTAEKHPLETAAILFEK